MTYGYNDWMMPTVVVDPDGVQNLSDAEEVEPTFGCECETCRCGSSGWDECFCVKEYHDPDCPDLTDGAWVVVPC